MGIKLLKNIFSVRFQMHKVLNFANVFALKTAYWQKVKIFFLGITGSASIAWIFDYLLYPFIIWKVGILYGGLLMTILSMIVSYGAIYYYDKFKKDWLWLEAIKELKEYEGGSKIGKISSWILKRSEFVMFILFSIRSNPFVTTMFMRHGARKFNGMTARDWKIFFLSLIISNFFWLLPAYGIAFSGKSIVGYFFE